MAIVEGSVAAPAPAKGKGRGRGTAPHPPPKSAGPPKPSNSQPAPKAAGRMSLAEALAKGPALKSVPYIIITEKDGTKSIERRDGTKVKVPAGWVAGQDLDPETAGEPEKRRSEDVSKSSIPASSIGAEQRIKNMADQVLRTLDKFSTVLDNSSDGTCVAVVTLLGSLAPVTLGHVRGFEEARCLFLNESSRAKRPARLEEFGVVLGLISLNGDGHVRSKLGEEAMDFETRKELVQLATEDYSWIDYEKYEGACLEPLRARWPNLKFVHFCMNGADDVEKYQKYRWATPKVRFITMGRPGYTQKVLDGMKECGVDADAGYFVMGPELPDISSTQVRAALQVRDSAALSKLLHPRVLRRLGGQTVQESQADADQRLPYLPVVSSPEDATKTDA